MKRSRDAWVRVYADSINAKFCDDTKFKKTKTEPSVSDAARIPSDDGRA